MSKTFPANRRGNTVQALHGIDLELAPGELVAVIGPSGCGKSTLLRCLADLERPDAGTVLIDGRAPVEMTRQHRVGVAFQDHALLPWLTVEKNVGEAFRLAGQPVDQSRVDELLAIVGLADRRRARPKELSGGMRQRVSIARSLVLEPAVLLLDEPFGALDAITRRQLNGELERIWLQLATTTLLITHDVGEAVTLADRVVVMQVGPGRIERQRTVPLPRPRTDEVTRDPTFTEVVQELTDALRPADT